MADYANNQTIEQPEVQSLTTNQKIKYETAAIIDQVGTESLFVWVGNMYFSVEMSGSPQKLSPTSNNTDRRSSKRKHATFKNTLRSRASQQVTKGNMNGRNQRIMDKN